MKCTFTAREPSILLEAQPGDLFVPLGPRLVECVCAARSWAAPASAGFDLDTARADRLDPEAWIPVVVLACRIGKGEPEYYPPGYQTFLRGAAPITFLEQVAPLALRERNAQVDAHFEWGRIVTTDGTRKVDDATTEAMAERICRDFEDMPLHSL